VTEIEVDRYEKKFVPGVDFLAGACWWLHWPGAVRFCSGRGGKPSREGKNIAGFLAGTRSINRMKKFTLLLAQSV